MIEQLQSTSSLGLPGCTASSINTKAPEVGAYASVNEHADAEVSYLNVGVESVRDARRTDAYKKMRDFRTAEGSPWN